MTKQLLNIYKEWCFSRKNTLAFIHSLGDNLLNAKLNCPDLDTFAKHFLEMVNVQEAYSEAIETGEMPFRKLRTYNNFHDGMNKNELIHIIKKADNTMLERLNNCTDSTVILWDDEEKPIVNHLCALVSHEMFRVGQLVGFCYFQNIKIPEYVSDVWGIPQPYISLCI